MELVTLLSLLLLEQPTAEGGVFSHITSVEIVGAIMGICFVWILKYGKEKDKFDEKDESFSLKEWWRTWFLKRNDNIFAHVFFTFVAIWLGVENLQAWLGDALTVPQGVDQAGAAFIIGFTGTYVVEILKKGV